MYYEITRGLRVGKSLTPAQRTSSLFAEEPVVLGRVLRRGAGPIRISPEDFERNKVQLLRLERAGSIIIKPPQDKPQDKDVSITESVGLESPKITQADNSSTGTEPTADETMKATEIQQTESIISEEPPATTAVEDTKPDTTSVDEQPRKKKRKE
jgi:hypothetical protein